MGYLDKAHKKIQRDRMIREIMSSHEYKQAVKKDQEQAGVRAYCNFCMMACDFLELRHNYGSRGLRRFLEFAVSRMHYLADDNENYYQEMNEYFVDKFNVDVFDIMGMKVADDDAEI